MGAASGHFALMRTVKRTGAASAKAAEGFTMVLVGAGALASFVFGRSIAGMIAGIIAGIAYCLIAKLRISKMFDASLFALPFGWFFLRLGCSLVHDHIGRASQSPLAVAFPSGGAFDLGVLECLGSVPLIAIALLLSRREHAPGFMGGVLLAGFAAMRFGIDFAKDADRVAVGLTLIQLFAIGLFAVGALVSLLAWQGIQSNRSS